MAGSDPNKLLVKADKLTRLSLTRWSADWKSATLLYEQAANGFRIAKDYEKAKEALEKASKGQELISSPWDAAKHMESAAALAKELGKWNEVADFYKRASELYAECGRPQPASDALAKGARALEDSMPDEAIQLYTDACAILEEDGKEQMAFDLYRDATSVYIKNEKYTDAAALMLRFGVSADKCNATHSQCKAYLGAIIIYLYLHDIKQAEQCYNDCTQKSKQSHNIGWLESRVWSPWCPRKSKIKKPTSWRGLQIQSKTKQNKKRERKMQRAVVQVNSISALKVCPNHAGKITQLTRKLIPPFPPTTSSPQLPNPCVDLYFRSPVEGPYFDSRSISEYQQTLVQKLLPQAWSHDPLTTLKLIFHLPAEPFYAAAVWLHHNHPKTLACNLLPIADDGGIASVLEILSRLDAGHSVDDYPWTWTRMLYNISRQQNFCANPFVFRSSRVETTKEKASALLKRRKTIAMANKVAERYDRDPHYRFLHDRVSDLIAECLNYDIQELNKLKHKQQQQGEEGQEVLELKITSAASYCPSRPNSSKAPRPTGLLYESIARKFPLGIRLRKEVLVPLRQAMASRKSVQDDANPWGYDYHPFPRTECPIFKYMLELNEAIAAKSKSVPELIETGAVLPHQILRYAWKFEQAAELLWERMVEDLHQKQGKLNNCLVVCNVDKSSWFCSEAGPLGLLVSRLNSQDPWKGKVVSYTRNPRMHLIPPAKDLRSKCKFMGSWEEKDWWDKDWEKEVDVVKVVFDLILEVAVKENVKPEQMINKVFMFKEKYRHKDITWSGIRSSIFCAYKEIQRRFEAKGYKVPQLMIWSMNDRMNPLGLPECSAEQGVTLLRGFSDNLVKSFLDNDGEVGPEEIMEAAISNEKYQALAVVD